MAFLFRLAKLALYKVALEGGRWEAALLRGEAVLPWFKQYYGKNTGIVASLLLRFGNNLFLQITNAPALLIQVYTTIASLLV